MSAKTSAAISFLFLFVCGFVIGGLFLMPHLPPTPPRPVTMFEMEFWSTNWAGALLGIVLGGTSARSILRKPKT